MSALDEMARRVADIVTPRVIEALRPPAEPADPWGDDMRELIGVLYDAMRAPRAAVRSG